MNSKTTNIVLVGLLGFAIVGLGAVGVNIATKAAAAPVGSATVLGGLGTGATLGSVNGIATNLTQGTILNNTTSASTGEEASFQSSSVKVTPGKEDTLSLSKKKVKRLNINPNRTIPIFGAVGGEILGASIAIDRLNQQSTTEPIFVLINSPGGSVVGGAHFISAMQASKAPVYTICYSLCASMGAMIHQYGTKRYVVDRSILMFHPATVQYGGDVDRIYSFIKTIRRYTNKLELEVATRMGLSFDDYKSLVSNEYWVDAEDSVKDGAADEVVSVNIDFGQLMQQAAPEESEGEESEGKKKKAYDIYLGFQWICNHCSLDNFK